MTPTRVYYNLHKKKLSIQEKRVNDSGKKVWKVVRHADFVFLRYATFKVSEVGRQKVIREKKKNVHAFIQGFECKDALSGELLRVFYNPYKFSSFVDENGEEVHAASKVLIRGYEGGYSIFIQK